MSYVLRLFENGKEVSTSTVKRIGAANYPEVGQIVDEKWEVVSVISHAQAELRLQVERVKAGGPPFRPDSLPFWNVGCPVLAFFARAGTTNACTMGVGLPIPAAPHHRSGAHLTYVPLICG